MLAGLFAVVVALAGNILLSPADLRIFSIYFAVTAAAVALMFTRVQLLKALLAITGRAVKKAETRSEKLSRYITAQIQRINRVQIVYFTKGDDLATILFT